MPESLPVIELLQPALFSRPLRMNEVLVDLLPRQAHRRARIASGYIRHASNIQRGLCGHGGGGCRLSLRPCLSNEQGDRARCHDSQCLHVVSPKSRGRTGQQTTGREKRFRAVHRLSAEPPGNACGHVATPRSGTPSTQPEEIVNTLHVRARCKRVGGLQSWMP